MHFTQGNVVARSSNLPQTPPPQFGSRLPNLLPPAPGHLGSPPPTIPSTTTDRRAQTPTTETAPDLAPIPINGQIALAGPKHSLPPQAPVPPAISLQDGETLALAVESTLAQVSHRSAELSRTPRAVGQENLIMATAFIAALSGACAPWPEN